MTAKLKARPSTFNQSGLLFLPSRWQRAAVVRWLKRVHAWTGFWGALLFLMMGVSGALLNHRNVWKIEAGEPVEVMAANIAVPAGLIRDEKALGDWAKAEFELASDPRAPKKEGGDKNADRAVRFMGAERVQPVKWAQQFNHPNGRLIVEYVAGSTSVSARQEATNIWGFLKNLHKGSGVGLAWVLFLDSIAGALIMMSLTGFLLWSRLHGGRLLAGGIAGASLTAAVAAVWPFLL
jgi:hypothetical protein